MVIGRRRSGGRLHKPIALVSRRRGGLSFGRRGGGRGDGGRGAEVIVCSSLPF